MTAGGAPNNYPRSFQTAVNLWERSLGALNNHCTRAVVCRLQSFSLEGKGRTWIEEPAIDVAKARQNVDPNSPFPSHVAPCRM